MGNCLINKDIKYQTGKDLVEVNEDHESDREFLKLPYFWSQLSRVEAEDLLRRHADNPGTFLIRYGSTYGKLAVTVVVAQNNIGNAIIHMTDNSFYLEEGLKFPTLVSLVEYYKYICLPNKSTHCFYALLTNPILKYRPPVPRTWEVNEVNENTEEKLYYSRLNQHINDYRRRFGLSTPPLRSAHGYTCVFYESGSPVALRTPPLPRHVYTTVPDIDTTVPKQIMSDSDYLTMNPQVDLIRFS